MPQPIDDDIDNLGDGSSIIVRGEIVKCPDGEIGDHLWGREAFEIECSVEPGDHPPYDDGRPIKINQRKEGSCGLDLCSQPAWQQPHYRATDKGPFDLLYEDGFVGIKWRPSVHMPKWVSRIKLEITGLRVERLQDISVEDAIAEGLSTRFREHDAYVDLVSQYRILWETINGLGSWDKNPWVWVVEFKKI